MKKTLIKCLLLVVLFQIEVVAEEKNSLFGIKLLWDSYPDKSLKSLSKE